MNPPLPNPPERRRLWSPPSLGEMQALLPQFRFSGLLGRGGMGAVYRATQLSLDRLVAIKILPLDLLSYDEANFAERFRNEAVLMARLNHPGIVSVHESGEVGGLLYIVMEYVDGTDVGRLIQGVGRIEPNRATGILIQVCEALHYAHAQGVIHRDLKPANLLVTREGRVKIADFGLAKRSDAALQTLTQTNVAIGTPDFLAPEAWTPGTPLDARSDLYSLGVTLYQMLTGEVPRGLWKMPSVKAGVDARFDAIIDRAMQPDREARYQSAGELERDLKELQIDESSTPTPAPHRSPRRRMGKALVMAAACIAALLVLLWPSEPESNSTPTSPEVREAARWLIQEKAQFKIVSNGQQIDVKTEADLPDNFEIVYLWFDRWASSPPKPPPPAIEFERLHAVKTLRFAWIRLPGLPTTAYAFLTNNLQLTEVSIEGNEEVTDDIFRYLAPLDKLEYLAITHARALTGATMTNATWRSVLRYCDLGRSNLDEAGLRVLAGASELAHLRIEFTPISGAGLRALRNLPKLTRLSLSYCPRLTEIDLATSLSGFPALQSLELRNTAFDDRAAATVATLTNLTHLRLTATKLSDVGLAKLAGLNQLKVLDLGDTAVTEAGSAAFSQALPKCQVGDNQW